MANNLVIDTSVTMAWCFEDEASEASDVVLEEVGRAGARVPSLWHLEVTNVLLVAERKRRITSAQAARFLALLGQLDLEVAHEVAPMPELLELARRHRLSAYDASYLSLAERTGSRLATLDAALARAAAEAGIATAW
ncbi:type II toxin-antitoxin system VapC family toxin [Kribbia dieselivorans]|uniref:type II toxin-antitoxin system VapC family toxin n=1 Tax=Kribbia dieselivorans TaxID=331526 RepID=UPI0008391749|nr:type II toxin-antitoxin system VapC family toxin [Kribbia dieselivorans]